MSANTLKVKYHIYMEAEDISQTRILSAASYIKEKLESYSSSFIKEAQIADESDLDDFILRLYINVSEEVENAAEEAADVFVDEFLDLIEEIAHVQSFMEMEGSCLAEVAEQKEEFTFTSEAGTGHCEYSKPE